MDSVDEESNDSSEDSTQRHAAIRQATAIPTATKWSAVAIDSQFGRSPHRLSSQFQS